jgi:hypothetical protein
MDENMEQYENWANRKFARLVTGGASALADEMRRSAMHWRIHFN